MNTDLDILMPEDDLIEFTAADGQRYSIRLFVPFAVGAYLLDNADVIAQVFPQDGKRPVVSKTTFEVILKILGLMFREQYPEMTDEWIRKNVSLPRLIAIVIRVATPIYEYVTSLGILETVQPIKEPDGEN